MSTADRPTPDRNEHLTHGPGLHLRCPHCQHSIAIVDRQSLSQVTCPSCGSSFSLFGDDATATYQPGATRRIAHFELLEQVGIGQFGTVWKARDETLQRTVALKIPRRGQLGADETEFFFRDARAAAQLKHPRIVGVHEVGRDGDTVFIASDFIDGANLKEWLSARRLAPREAAELMIDVAEAVHHAHERGVVHRDLKPGNILLDRAGQPHVTDFGLAKRDTGEVTMTVDGQILGTPAYMSPEQARGKAHEADARSDVYSLGVILFELLTGEPPFRGEKRMLIVQILQDDPPSPRRLNAQVPRDLETICLKCLEKDPNRRYRTARELTEELRRFVAGEPIRARPLGRAARAWRWCRRRPVVASLLALLAVTLMAGITVSSHYAIQADSRASDALAETGRADHETQIARHEAFIGQRNLYSSHLGQVSLAWQLAQMGRVRELLAAQHPSRTGGHDFRDFEWYYWNHIAANSLPAMRTQDPYLIAMAASPDGNRVATWEAPSDTKADRATIRVRDVASGKQLAEFPCPTGLDALLAFSPDGKRLAAAEDNGDASSVRVWDVASGRQELKFSGQRVAAFSEDGKLIAVLRRDKAESWQRIVLVDAISGRDVRDLGVHQASLSCLAFSRDGRRLAVGAVSNIGSSAVDVISVLFNPGQITQPTLWVYETSGGKNPLAITFRVGVTAIAFRRDDQELAVIGTDKVARLWDLQQRRERAVLAGHTGPLAGIGYFRDGMKLVTASADQTVRTWDGKSGRELRAYRGHSEQIRLFAWDAVRQRAISASADGAIHFSDCKTDQQRRTADVSASWASKLICHPSGKFFGVTSIGAHLYEIPSGRHARTIEGVFAARLNEALACSRDGRIWATASHGSNGYEITLREHPSGKRLTRFTVGENSTDALRRGGAVENFMRSGVKEMTFLDSADRLIIADPHTAYVWHVGQGEAARWQTDKQHPMSKLAVHPGGDVIARVRRSDDERSDDPPEVWLWTVARKEVTRRLSGQAGQVVLLEFDDRDRLWSVSNQKLVVWNHTSGAIAHQFGITPCITAAINPRRTRLATGGVDGTLTLWDLETGQQLLHLLAFSRVVAAVTFTPDGQHLLATGIDDQRLQLRIWDAPSTP